MTKELVNHKKRNNMLQQAPIDIYLEVNPNPNSLKFVLNRTLLSEGMSFDFPDAASATHAPLAKQLLERVDVTRVFYMSNFITVTKSEEAEWHEIQDGLKQEIKQFIEGGGDILTQEIIVPESDEEDSETVKKIKDILDEYIRPAVEGDGGAITFHSYVDGVVKVLLQGACSGCPSSTITLKSGIENLMKTMLPNEVTSVEAESL
jgi:Fe-S cluster biogenesis protein NfuA